MLNHYHDIVNVCCNLSEGCLSWVPAPTMPERGPGPWGPRGPAPPHMLGDPAHKARQEAEIRGGGGRLQGEQRWGPRELQVNPGSEVAHEVGTAVSHRPGHIWLWGRGVGCSLRSAHIQLAITSGLWDGNAFSKIPGKFNFHGFYVKPSTKQPPHPQSAYTLLWKVGTLGLLSPRPRSRPPLSVRPQERRQDSRAALPTLQEGAAPAQAPEEEPAGAGHRGAHPPALGRVGPGRAAAEGSRFSRGF